MDKHGYKNAAGRSKIKELVIYALFAALTAAAAQIYLPLPFTPVPVNLSTLAVMLSGVLCSLKFKPGGFIPLFIYIALGAVGLPVFAGFKGGFGVIAGPTGGYIIGYVFITAAGVFLCGKKKLQNALALAFGIALCYTCGAAWFMLATGNGLRQSLVMCVFPFIAGDILKTLSAVIIADRLKPLLMKF